MYAIIKENKIIGGASDVETAEWSAANTEGASYVAAPEDFTVYGFKFVDGAVVPKTDADIQQEESLSRVLMSRKDSYPPIGDQLDALWKGGDAAAEMLAKVQAVKAKYPKPE